MIILLTLCKTSTPNTPQISSEDGGSMFLQNVGRQQSTTEHNSPHDHCLHSQCLNSFKSYMSFDVHLLQRQIADHATDITCKVRTTCLCISFSISHYAFILCTLCKQGVVILSPTFHIKKNKAYHQMHYSAFSAFICTINNYNIA
jgi:hypothetical protein